MVETEAQSGGDKYVPDTEEVYWQRDPADLPELYQKELSGAQGHRFRSSTRRSFRVRQRVTAWRRTVYHHTTASTSVVHRGHLIGPKPDNRCSAWAVLFPCLRVPGGPALGVTRSPWLGQGAVTRFEDGGGLSYLTGANGRTDLALQRQWAREWRRGAHEGREGGRRDLAPGSSGMLWW